MSTTTTQFSMFPCNQCGLCCQRVDQSDETRYLDRGDGACMHYNVENKSCSIYAQRPDICRVERQYVQRFSQHYSWDEFKTLNVAVCTMLQNES